MNVYWLWLMTIRTKKTEIDRRTDKNADRPR